MSKQNTNSAAPEDFPELYKNYKTELDKELRAVIGTTWVEKVENKIAELSDTEKDPKKTLQALSALLGEQSKLESTADSSEIGSISKSKKEVDSIIERLDKNPKISSSSLQQEGAVQRLQNLPKTLNEKIEKDASAINAFDQTDKEALIKLGRNNPSKLSENAQKANDFLPNKAAYSQLPMKTKMIHKLDNLKLFTQDLSTNITTIVKNSIKPDKTLDAKLQQVTDKINQVQKIIGSIDYDSKTLPKIEKVDEYEKALKATKANTKEVVSKLQTLEKAYDKTSETIENIKVKIKKLERDKIVAKKRLGMKDTDNYIKDIDKELINQTKELNKKIERKLKTFDSIENNKEKLTASFDEISKLADNLKDDLRPSVKFEFQEKKQTASQSKPETAEPDKKPLKGILKKEGVKSEPKAGQKFQFDENVKVQEFDTKGVPSQTKTIQEKLEKLQQAPTKVEKVEKRNNAILAKENRIAKQDQMAKQSQNIAHKLEVLQNSTIVPSQPEPNKKWVDGKKPQIKEATGLSSSTVKSNKPIIIGTESQRKTTKIFPPLPTPKSNNPKIGANRGGGRG